MGEVLGLGTLLVDALVWFIVCFCFTRALLFLPDYIHPECNELLRADVQPDDRTQVHLPELGRGYRLADGAYLDCVDSNHSHRPAVQIRIFEEGQWSLFVFIYL